jgi:hypothetical protein
MPSVPKKAGRLVSGVLKQRKRKVKRNQRGNNYGAKMVEAVKAAIRSRSGSIRDLPYEQQILIGRAMVILSAVPDNAENKYGSYDDSSVLSKEVI